MGSSDNDGAKNLFPKEFHCDNKAVITKMTQSRTLHTLAPKWDILEPLILTVSGHNVKCSHVKGHRDEEVEENELSKIEKLNVRVDQLVEQGRRNATLKPTVPGHRALLTIEGTPITTDYA